MKKLKKLKCESCGWDKPEPVEKNNPFFKCGSCGERKTMKIVEAIEVESPSQNPPQTNSINQSNSSSDEGSNQTDSDNNRQSEFVDVLEFTIEETEDENGDTKSSVDFEIPEKTKVDSKTKISIPLDEKLIKKGYKVLDKIGQNLEKRVLENQESIFYGSELLDFCYDFNAKMISKLTKSKGFKLDVGRAILWSNVPILGGIIVLGASLIGKRNKRRKEEHELSEEEEVKYQ